MCTIFASQFIFLSYSWTLFNVELNTKMSMKGSSCMWPWFCSCWPSYVASSSATGKTEFTLACLTSFPSHQVSCLLFCVSVEFWMPFLTSCWFGTIAPWQSVKVSSSAMDPGQKLSDETTVCKRLFTLEDVTLLLSHEKSLINNGFNKLSPGPSLSGLYHLYNCALIFF